MIIYSPDLSPFVTTINGKIIYFKTVDIPAWNMYLGAVKNVDLNIPANSLLLSYSAWIGADLDLPTRNFQYPLTAFDTASGICDGGFLQMTGGHIVLGRRDAGNFSSSAYSNTVLPRGIILISYLLV